MSDRQERIARLKAAFEKVQKLIDEGCSVLWDGEEVKGVNFVGGVCLEHEGLYCTTEIYSDEGIFDDMTYLTIEEINKQLKERLTVWKKVDITL